MEREEGEEQARGGGGRHGVGAQWEGSLGRLFASTAVGEGKWPNWGEVPRCGVKYVI